MHAPTNNARPKASALLLVTLLCASAFVALPAQAASSGPKVDSALFIDQDSNGHSDGVVLDWSKAIRDTTVRPSDFQVRFGGASQRATGFSTLVNGVGTANDDKMTLYYPEFANYDGEGTLTISYTGPAADSNPEGVKDTTAPTLSLPYGEAPPSSGDVFATTTYDDDVVPYLRGLYAKETDSRIYAVFTERVGTSTGAATAPIPANFCVSLGGQPPLTISSIEGTAPSRVYGLVLSRALTTSDLANIRISVGTAGCNAIVDTRTNMAVVPDMDPYTTGVQDLLIGAPYLLRVHGSRGDTTMVAEFSGPVGTVGGAAFTDTSALQLTSGGAATGYTIASSVAGSDRIQMTASGVPTAADFAAGTGACFRVNTNAVYGWKSGTSTIPAATGAACSTPNANTKFLVDGTIGTITHPRVVSVTSRDVNEDGMLDAVDVQFNEDMGTPAKEGWTITFPRNPAVPVIPMQNMTATGASLVTPTTVRVTFTPPANSGTGILPRVSYCESDSGANRRLSAIPYVVGTPQDCDAAGFTRMADLSGNQVSRAGAPRVHVPYMVLSEDGARPILTNAATIDTSPTPNGNTNGYLLTFSEPIEDTTFDHTTWTATAPGSIAITITGKDTVIANDNQMRLLWNERGYDTGVVPDLTYTGGPDEAQFLKDRRAGGGLRLEDIRSGSGAISCPPTGRTIAVTPTAGDKTLCEVDGVGPYLIEVGVTVGAREARARFSEEVPSSVAAGDFAYRARNSVGASSITGALRDTDEFDHVDLQFNANIVTADISGTPNDCIQLFATFRDAAGNQAYPPFDTVPTAACRNFLNSDAPKLSAAEPPETIDSNNDGYLDAIRLTFTKPIRDTSIGAASQFLYRFGDAPNVTASGVITGGASAVACPVSSSLEPNVVDDNVIFVCFGDVQRTGIGPLPNTAATPRVSFTRPGSATLASTDGQPVGAFVLAATVDRAPPVLVEAQGNPGSNSAILLFSEPVSGVGGRPLAPGDFLYANGNPGTSACPSTASNIATVTGVAGPGDTSGPMSVPIVLNGPLSNADLGLAPGCTDFDSIRPNPAGVVELASAGSKAAYLPPVPMVPFKDTLPPLLGEAGFIDGNGDGVLDAVRLRFGEFVDDNSLGLTGSWQVKFGTSFLRVQKVSTGYDGTDPAHVDACLTGGAVAPTRPDDETAPARPQANDDHLFLCLDTSTVASAGGTRDLGTGVEGRLGYAPPNEASRGKDLAGNRLPNQPDVPIADKARPVVLNRGGTDPVHAQTADRNGNGRIDAMRLAFSEPVRDSSFTATQWTVTGRTVLGLDTVGVPNQAAGLAGNDTRIWISINETTAPDTGRGSVGYAAAPDIVYLNTGTMTDLKGNKVRAIAGGACTPTQTGCAAEVDGAGPVVVGAEARAGTNFAKITFSEKIAFGPNPPGLPCGRPIRGTDLQFLPGNSGGAGGIITVAHDFLGGCGANNMTVGFDATLTADDVSKDRIGFILGGQTDSIREAAGSGSPAVYLPLVNSFSWLNRTIDGTPPAGITDLKGKAVTDTAHKIEWTAPTATDLASYEVRHCQCKLNQANFTSAATTRVTTAVPSPLSGAAQNMTLTGLTAGRTYTVAIRALDTDGNFAPISNVYEFKAEAPDTATPDAVSSLRIDSTAGTSVTLIWKAPGEDGRTGTVSSYEVAAGVGMTTDAQYANNIVSGVTFNPTPLAAPDADQRATVNGLTAGANLVFAVRAVDAAGNKGPWMTVTGVVGTLPNSDSTAPGPINDLKATAGDPPSSSVVLSWTAPGDNLTVGRVSGYKVLVSPNPITATNLGTAATVSFQPTAFVTAGQKQNATVTGLQAGTTYYFSVSGQDEVPNVATPAIVNFTTAVNPNAVTTEQLTDVIEELNDCLEANPVEGGVELTWCLPDVDGKTPVGIQLWRLENGTYVLVKTLRLADPEFANATWIDTAGEEGDEYKATAFFDETAGQGFVAANGSPESVPGFTSADATLASSALPMWVWIALGVAVLLILALILALVLKGRRGRAVPADAGDDGGFVEAPAEEAPAEQAWQEAPAEPAPAKPAPNEAAWTEAAQAPPAPLGAPPMPAPSATTHYVTCPSCATDFRATGVKPLAIQCPSCGVRGALR